MPRAIYLFGLLLFLCSCENSSNRKSRPLTQEFKDYWYSGEAEITSYKLQQARYGEIRNGTSVLVYVTEDFLPDQQVKADSQEPQNISVLKLNNTKKFVTGIYPYSIMQSSFFPLEKRKHALKVSASIQEWCGQVYMQLNNRNSYIINSHSYFAGEADQELSLPKTYLENEIWNQLRIDPDLLPSGEIKMIPSFEFIRLKHKEIKAYQAIAGISAEDSLKVFSLEYPDLRRKLKIYFRPEFPYEIEKWQETYKSGFGKNAKSLTTTAEKMARIKSAYWTKNSNNDLSLRKRLQLE